MKKKPLIDHKWLRNSIIIGIWLLIWQLVSLWVNNSILLVGPVETVLVLLGKIVKSSFWQTILGSLWRIAAGFLAGWLLGMILAAGSCCSKWLEAILEPVMLLMKTMPVASFVVLFLIWFRTSTLAVVISLFVVLPNVYLNTLEGMKSTERKLLEMAAVYKLHPLDRFFYIYRPALRPFWESSMRISVGMSWKAGVAAEVIGTPDFSIGEQLYMSKIHLDTAGVLAWTAVIIGISLLCEKIFLKLWQRFMEWQPACRGVGEAGKAGENTGEGPLRLCLKKVSKSYEEKVLFEDFSAVYREGEIYYFKTPSGSGKTTLFRMIAGLETADGGRIENAATLAYAFQEDRLCEDYSALKNVELITGDGAAAAEYLKPLLSEEDMQKPCRYLSGGMKRKAAVARAFATQRSVVLLDEPFAGLDEENRLGVQNYIKTFGKNKIVLIATHL